MINKDITVAIVTRNRSKQLKRCLTALVKQEVLPFSTIVIDNASTDRTKNVLEVFKTKLSIAYVYEKRIGVAYARNRALSRVTTKILAFTDDDCEPFPDWIRKIAEKHKQYPSAAAIQGWSFYKPRGRIRSMLVEANFISNFHDNFLDDNTPLSEFFDADHKIMTLDTKNLSLDMNKIRKLGIHFDPNFRRGSDIDFARQLLKLKQQIIFSPSICVYHQERDNLKDYLRQRVDRGKQIILLRKKWPESADFKYQFILRRFGDLHRYLKYNRQTDKAIIIIPLFLLDKAIVLLGKLIAKLRFSPN
jgi:GT2 family glycosyltransferase